MLGNNIFKYFWKREISCSLPISQKVRDGCLVKGETGLPV